MKLRFLLAVVLLVSAAAPARAQEAGVSVARGMGGPALTAEHHVVMGPGPLPSLSGGFIPPDLAARVGISPELLERLEAVTFEANDALIPLEADVRRAQLQLERLLRATTPDEAAVGRTVDTLSRAEAAVRKNRLGLFIQVRKLLGPELWRKLETAFHEELRRGGGMMIKMRGSVPPDGPHRLLPPP